MAVSTRPVLHGVERADRPLPGPTLQVLCGLAWFGVACAFSFLDRARDAFPVFALAWLALGLVGFGLGILHRARPERARPPARVLTVLACVFALVPGLLMFTLVRWAAFALLLVTAARAAAMHVHRDLYYALAAVVAVSLLVVTHGNAAWTVWFYLAPAWLCVVLALAWDHAGQVRLRAPLKAGMAVTFVAVCVALGVALSALLPLPRTDGFGFLDPPTTNPLHAGRSAAAGATGSAGEGASGSGDAAGGAGARSRLGDLAEALHRALRDKGLPQWQRSMVEGMLATVEFVGRVSGRTDARVAGRMLTPREMEQARQRAQAVQSFLDALWHLLWLLLALWLLWRLRWRIAGALALGGAGLLAPWSPGRSMRCSMLALHCLLHRRGQPRDAGQSVLEHVDSAAFLAPTLRQGLRRAVQAYGAWRFGGAQASGRQAREVRRAVAPADELLRKEARA